MTRFSNSRLAMPVGAADAVSNWTAPLRARWQTLGVRERRALAVAAWVLGLFLIDRLDAQLQQMQRQATEARELRGTPALNSSQSAAALRAATEALGAAGRLQVVGDRATLTLTGINGSQLRDWLAEARTAARARPLEANLTRGLQGYAGSIVVALPSGSAAP
jgi:general secretion pathway protein M